MGNDAGLCPAPARGHCPLDPMAYVAGETDGNRSGDANTCVAYFIPLQGIAPQILAVHRLQFYSAAGTIDTAWDSYELQLHIRRRHLHREDSRCDSTKWNKKAARVLVPPYRFKPNYTSAPCHGDPRGQVPLAESRGRASGVSPPSHNPSFSFKNAPVYDPSHRATSSGVPRAITVPPASPPSGPMSMI